MLLSYLLLQDIMLGDIIWGHLVKMEQILELLGANFKLRVP
jgi:hypothetical protein